MSRVRIPHPIVSRWGRFNLSMIASGLAQLAREQADSWDDLHALDGSGECGPLVAASHRRETRDYLEALGLSADEVLDLLKQRVSGKWLHYRFPGADLLDQVAAEDADAAERHKEFVRRLGEGSRLSCLRDWAPTALYRPPLRARYG